MYATVEQVNIRTEALHLVNLVHTYFDRIYTVNFPDITGKKIALFVTFK